MTEHDTIEAQRVAAHDLNMVLATQGVRAMLRLIGADPDHPDLHNIPNRVVAAVTEFAELAKGEPNGH